jgi:hypothetical protein
MSHVQQRGAMFDQQSRAENGWKDGWILSELREVSLRTGSLGWNGMAAIEREDAKTDCTVSIQSAVGGRRGRGAKIRGELSI